jgi:hypothetical protein
MFLVKKVLFIQIVGIILFHSLIPHRHHEEMTNVEHNIAHENANDLIDYLGLIFHEGPNDTLKNYTISEISSQNNVNFPANMNFDNIEILPAKVCLYFGDQPQKLFSCLKTLSNGLRAPPVHDYYL